MYRLITAATLGVLCTTATPSFAVSYRWTANGTITVNDAIEYGYDEYLPYPVGTTWAVDIILDTTNAAANNSCAPGDSGGFYFVPISGGVTYGSDTFAVRGWLGEDVPPTAAIEVNSPLGNTCNSQVGEIAVRFWLTDPFGGASFATFGVRPVYGKEIPTAAIGTEVWFYSSLYDPGVFGEGDSGVTIRAVPEPITSLLLLGLCVPLWRARRGPPTSRADGRP